MKITREHASFSLYKDFSFEASHQLTKVPTGHKCGNLHGHSYRIRVHCCGKLDLERDWVVDYSDISKAASPIIEELDHCFLNHRIGMETTAENLAWWFSHRISPLLPQLSGVEVFETPTTSVFLNWSQG
jgi:6-pyruvoyltetrahydropterin/6-carboxytetrahydropterin synthase